MPLYGIGRKKLSVLCTTLKDLVGLPCLNEICSQDTEQIHLEDLNANIGLCVT